MASVRAAERLPAVAIVGRPNVGKSALFNRLAGRRIAIVHDQPGVTRDRIHAVCRRADRPFEIIDTGGIGGSTGDSLASAVREEAEIGIRVARLVLLIVDAQDGLTPVDEELARRLRRSGKPVLLVVNKVDHEAHEGWGDEFLRLGLGTPHPVSAAHGRGVPSLIDEIEGLLGEAAPVEDGAVEGGEEGGSAHPVRIAVVGRPNVGKSSLVNALLEERRTIVSEIPGTTRDSVDVEFERGARRYVLVDTAGIRHRSRHRTSVEVFSAMRAERAISRCDICVLVIDLTMGATAQDRQIGHLIHEAHRPCVIVGSKWDLVRREAHRGGGMAAVGDALRGGLFFLEHAPVVLLSSMCGDHVRRLMPEIERVVAASERRIGTGRLNRFLHGVIETTPPPARGGRRFKLLYATQLEGEGGPVRVPRFVLFVNDPSLLAPDYLRFLAGKIREEEPYPGLPVVFELRGRPRGEEGRAPVTVDAA